MTKPLPCSGRAIIEHDVPLLHEESTVLMGLNTDTNKEG